MGYRARSTMPSKLHQAEPLRTYSEIQQLLERVAFITTLNVVII
ncbi:hypothetical protein COLO4_36482 [Corchorus olitorius]|uniref:Uncharacterized protein n=1 Tax=Corchorus olitorius TaxID=93759 RepID=A0A1R3G8Q6_9ROSI|nr:hypothetical protein COLO4_36482 [Corchorus olitorius]